MSEAYERLRPLLGGLENEVRDVRALLGLDGTVDVICRPVASRRGPGDDYHSFGSMADFGERVVAADGKSAIIELVEQQRKIGGNGPIMARALAASGLAINYLGTVGDEVPDPAYEEFATRIDLHCLAAPAVTHALEFPNGKLMLGELSSYQAMNASTLRDRIGAEKMAAMLEPVRLIGLLNWSCLPGFTSILEWLLVEVLPAVPVDPERVIFFDLADPSMRSSEDLRSVLQLVTRCSAHGRVVLGMNLNETQRVAKVLEVEPPEDDPASLSAALLAVRGKLGIALAVGHATTFACCAGSNGGETVAGPHTPEPRITTGAGDHFNAGFCLGLLGGWLPADALALGVLYSGYYVRHARSPRLGEISDFIQSIDP
jgi:sugar/nucleoside kinase (ribokinase family)